MPPQGNCAILAIRRMYTPSRSGSPDRPCWLALGPRNDLMAASGWTGAALELTVTQLGDRPHTHSGSRQTE
jgi:hypothetical protein